LCLVCLGLLNTLVRQINLMVPHAVTPNEQKAVQVARAAWQSDRRINNPLAVLNVLYQRNPDEQELGDWARMTDNSLPIWAELLSRLREAGIEPVRPTTTQPQDAENLTPATSQIDTAVSGLIARLEYAPPLRLGLARLHETFLTTLTERGVSARRAEAIFRGDRWSGAVAVYRPVLRELNGRLLALAHHHQQAGRPAEATRVYRAAIRMWTDVVADSPLPEVATLAAAKIDFVLREAGAIELGPATRPVAEALQSFQHTWVDVPQNEINLIPLTFEPVATDAHRRVVKSLVAGGALVGFGWALAVVCLVLLAAVVILRPRGLVPLAWRWGGWGAVVAPAVVSLPLIAVVLMVASDAVPFIWLTSLRSLPAVVFAPATLLFLWLLATEWCLIPTTADGGRGRLPVRSLAGGLLLIVASAGVATFIPLNGESWSPPVGVQLFRRLGTVVGLLAGIIFVVWLFWGWRRRRSANWPAGVWARGALAVASTSMAVMLAAATIGLALNQHRDRLHEAAFAAAAMDPVGSRLGSDWWAKYFAPARALSESSE